MCNKRRTTVVYLKRSTMKNFLLGILVLTGLSSCLKGESGSTCSYDPCGIKAPDSEIQAVQSYLTTNTISATQHCSGLFYTVDLPGSGATPTVCNYVTVNYEGRLTNGTVFDKTQPGSPAGFNLSSLIAGFKNGVPLIKTGGKITLYVPPSLGYGSQPQGTIPANSILIFNVELLNVQ